MRKKTKAAIAGIALLTMACASPLRAETKLSAGARTFAGFHEKQGSLLGGGISLGAGEKTSLQASMDIASLSLGKPEIYSYGISLSFHISGSARARAFCAKDGIIGTPGCGGWLFLDKGRFSLGAAGEYRTTNTISMKASIASKFRIAFLRIKAMLLGYLNTKDKDEMSGGADAGLEIGIMRHIGIYSRYNYFTKGSVRGQHAFVSGLAFHTD